MTTFKWHIRPGSAAQIQGKSACECWDAKLWRYGLILGGPDYGQRQAKNNMIG